MTLDRLMQALHNLPDRYTIQATLGEGGYGVVYKAFDYELDREVAIKVLSNVSTASKSSLKKEFETLSKLNHPHLVKVFGYGFLTNDIPYFTMEYIEGANLKTFLSKPQAIQHLPLIIDQTLQALSHLHEKQIIHSDIKPDNIFVSVTESKTVSTKLLDFGLASTIQEKSIQTSGTPRFIAPEVLSKKAYLPASDLYSLGMTLIESLTSRQVPSALDIDDTFYKQTQKELSGMLASHDIPNPSAVSSFIVDLVQIAPEDRPTNASEASQRFKIILDVSSHDIIIKIDNVFIGREHELNVIGEFLTKGRSNKRILILEGPRGIGKKRLMQKAVSMAQPEGYFVIDLSSDSFTRNTIEQLINTISANLTPSKRNRFLTRHKKILQLVKSQTEAEKKSIDNTRVAYSNMVEYLQEIASHNLTLICIPDIERFSEDFYIFVDQLIHEMDFNPNDIRLVISCNSDVPTKKRLSNIIDKSINLDYSQKIEISLFGQRELEALQLVLFERCLFNKHQSESIIRDTDGLPLLIIEHIRHLVANRTVRFESSLWHLDQSTYDVVPIPSSITEFIQNEYSKLIKPQKDILQVMAYWERTIPFDILKDLLSGNKEYIDHNVVLLTDRMLIKKEDSDSVRFPHTAYSKFIKTRTSKGKAQKINKSILQYLEDHGSNDYERLAHHSIEAGLVEKAFKYGFQAVDLLEQGLEYYKCYELLSKLKTLILRHGNEKQTITILEHIAPIELHIGQPNIALKDYSVLLERTMNYSNMAYYSRAIFNIYYNYLGNPNKAMTAIERAMTYATNSGDLRIRAELLLDLSMIKKGNKESIRKNASAIVKNVDINLYAKIISYLLIAHVHAGHYSEAKAKERELQNLLDVVSPQYKSFIYIGLYISYFYTGVYDSAKHYLEERIKTDKALCDEISIIASYNSLGGIHYVQGNYYDQIKTLITALNGIQKYSTYDSSFYLSNISLAYRSMADYREAYKALTQATSYYDHLKGKYANEWVLSKYVYFYAFLGNSENKNYNKYLARTISVATRANNSIVIGHTKQAKSIYNYHRLQCSQALRNINAAIKTFRSANARDDIVDTLRLLTMILIEKNELTEAKKTAKEARKIFDEIHCDYLKPQLLLAEGALARAQHSDTAESKLKEALKTSKKMFTREYTWQIQRELALYHKDRGELHKSLQYYRDAIDMIKEITETIDGEELKTSYLSLPFRKRVFDEIKALKKQLN